VPPRPAATGLTAAKPHNGDVVGSFRGMPWGVGLFLAYALLILSGVGLSLGAVVEQAVLVPITFLGVVMMALLAYTIFTITLVLQRKAAARGLAYGLTSLAIPAIPLALLGRQLIIAAVLVLVGYGLYRGLRSPATGAWLDQP
jgi:hypothetical protein